MKLAAALFVVSVVPAVVFAQPQPDPGGEGTGSGSSGGSGTGSSSGTGGGSASADAAMKAAAANAAATRALEQRMHKLEDELDQAKDDNKYLEDKVEQLLPLVAKFSGYVDLGFFATTGNGAGTRSDLGNVYFPQYAGVVPESWVFMGDPLSTTVNSRGDVADTGESRAVTFDPINTHGKSTFLVNAVNFQMFSGIGDTASVQTSIDFVPRARDISDPSGLFAGDYIDVKLAYGEWRPKLDAFGLALQVGKFDSVVGYEYRLLESPDRMTVTPSLLCRYTCGRPIGVKARMKFLDDALIANVSITNGSNFTEGFDFSNETDQNQFKTGSGRLSYSFAKKVEVGISGAYGAQDWQDDDAVYQWHSGLDVHAELGDLELTGELIHGRAKGKRSAVGPPCDIAACLDYTAWYALVGYRVSNTLQPYARVDYRDALHTYGASFVYISDLYRFTVGLRAELGSRVIAKVEATKVLETEGIPDFPDDVFTSSLVIKY